MAARTNSKGDDPSVSDPQSVTVWFDRLREGDADAAAALWTRYFERLVHVARSQLNSRYRRVTDEEDIAAEVMQSLCAAAERDQLPDIDGRDDLWRMLLSWTRHNIVDHVRRETRRKRGGGDVRGDSVASRGFDQFPSLEPTAETFAQLSEQLSRRLTSLPDDRLRRIARLRLAGYDVKDIAEQLDVSSRTIDRKLALIRSLWADADVSS